MLQAEDVELSFDDLFLNRKSRSFLTFLLYSPRDSNGSCCFCGPAKEQIVNMVSSGVQ